MTTPSPTRQVVPRPTRELVRRQQRQPLRLRRRQPHQQFRPQRTERILGLGQRRLERRLGLRRDRRPRRPHNRVSGWRHRRRNRGVTRWTRRRNRRCRTRSYYTGRQRVCQRVRPWVRYRGCQLYVRISMMNRRTMGLGVIVWLLFFILWLVVSFILSSNHAKALIPAGMIVSLGLAYTVINRYPQGPH